MVVIIVTHTRTALRTSKGGSGGIFLLLSVSGFPTLFACGDGSLVVQGPLACNSSARGHHGILVLCLH